MSISNSSNILITGNNITSFLEGVDIENCSNIMFSNNILSGTGNPGVFVQGSNDNTFCGNSFWNDSCGIVLEQSNDNLIYDNNFQDNFRDTSCQGTKNAWDNGSEGNYWSNYTGVDLNADGIGDTPNMIDGNNTDNHPLTGTFKAYESGYEEVDCISNSSVISFKMEVINSSQATLFFNVTGQDGTQGFLRLCIPKTLVNGSYTVRFDGQVISDPQFRILPESNANYTYIYLNYTHSQHTIEISGSTTIPELPSIAMLIVLISGTMLSTLFCKRKGTASKKQTGAQKENIQFGFQILILEFSQ
jgi:parallel beta-helix repeat protein